MSIFLKVQRTQINVQICISRNYENNSIYNQNYQKERINKIESPDNTMYNRKSTELTKPKNKS